MKKFLFFLFIILFLTFGVVTAQMTNEKVYSPTVEGSTSSISQSQDIKKELPQPQFIFPLGGEILKDKIKIQMRVAEAISVEFYVRPSESLMEIYLGKGQKVLDVWELEFDTQNLPNGNYFLFAKIYNLYGVYQSPEIKIIIQNIIERNIVQEDQLKQEILPKETEILNKETEINKVVEGTKTEIEKIVNQTTENLEKTLPLDKKQELENQLQQRLVETIKNIINYQKTLENEVKIEKEIIPESERKKIIEEKNSIQNQIVQNIVSPINEIEKGISTEEKLVLEEKIKSLLKETEIILKEKIKEKSEISPLTLLDSDNDNLSDWDEIRIKTDPFNPDTDGDGFLDGFEVEAKYDPLKAGAADKVVFQDPRKFGRISEKIKIEKIEIVQLKDGENGLRIKGVGIPNSFMTLYIFSSPLVAMVKVDSNGNFEYILDKTIADGYHAVYVALNNNRGEIQEKSQSFVFLKSGDRIMRISEMQAGIPQGPTEVLGRNFLILTISLILFALSATFFLVGFLGRNKIQ